MFFAGKIEFPNLKHYSDQMQKNLLLLFFLVLCFQGKTQKPDEVLTSWSERSPIEKVYLHLDRETYFAGETIWFKAYFYSEFLPDTISTSVFVELLDGSSKIISRKIFPVFFFAAKGQIELPDTLTEGEYFLRAYSPTMLNQEAELIYEHEVYVFSKKKNKTVNKIPERNIRLEFFPEGGNFISNLENTIAFKATGENGMPVNISGSVKDERGEVIANLSCFHDGMGIFDITPLENEKYFVELDNDNGKAKYFLPEANSKGIVFRITHTPQKLMFEIAQKKNDTAFTAASIVGQMQHQIIFHQKLSSNTEKIKGLIRTDNLYSGIMQITVFNKDNIPLAERLVFINNKEYIQQANLIIDTLDLDHRGKNHFSLLLNDSVAGSFSVSVTDPEYDISPQRHENIFSSLLLTSDIKGFVNDPAYYFSGDADSVANALDLVMMTNGWRRFKWKELLSSPLPAKKYEDAAYISIRGNIRLEGTKKNFANKQLMVFISSPDSSRSIQMLQTDDKGDFRLDSLVFFDYTRFWIIDVRGKKSKWVDVRLYSDSLTRSYPLPALDVPRFVSFDAYDSLSNVKNGKFSDEFDIISKAEGKMLPGVVIKVKKKSALEELEERYESPLFSGGFAERTLDLTNEKVYGFNIFEYLRERIPGLRIVQRGVDYELYYRGMTSFTGATQMEIFLDEMRTDANIVASIPPQDIALVKVFSSFVGASGNAPGGVIAFYTKKGSDLYKNFESEGNRFIYHGYSVIKEFYSPDYSVDTTKRNSFDRRITLYWQPNIFGLGKNVTVPIIFYNNDRSKRFKIVAEGITTSGKLLCIEKILEANDNKKAF